MKELDCIEVTVEKEKYAKYGVHKGMQGWICDPRLVQNTWLVNFPQYGEKDDIATISIDMEDMREIPVMDLKCNERLKAQFDTPAAPGDLDGYLI